MNEKRFEKSNPANADVSFNGTGLCVLAAVNRKGNDPDLESFERLISQLVAANVELIQLRDKQLSDQDLIAAGNLLTRSLRQSGSGTRWIMNDRADLAAQCGADGVHLGQDDLSVAAARKIPGLPELIGVSTHNLDQARKAVADGASYIGVGPVFPSRTKSFDAFVGTSLLRDIANEIPIPAFAIGGIDRSNIGQVVSAGIRRAAVSSAVNNAADPQIAAEQLIAVLAGSNEEGV